MNGLEGSRRMRLRRAIAMRVRRAIATTLLGAAGLTVAPALAGAAVWNVYPGGTGGNRRADAQPTIQAAIDAASNGDTVLVAPGTYEGPGNRDIELHGKAIAVIGGGGPLETTIECDGATGDPHRGFYLHEREGESTLIQGFTITKGYVEGPLPASYGGAILCTQSSPTIRDCRLVGNRSNHFGGGMVCYINASPILERVDFIDNSAVNNGGGFGSKKDCHPKLSQVLFVRNRALRGGAFWCWSAGATIDRATFYGNVADMSAAGVWTNWADVTVSNSIIAGSTRNVADCTGDPPSVRFVDCDLFGNARSDSLPECSRASGIFSADPLFCDPQANDFRVRAESPCAPGRHPEGVAGAGWIGAMEACETGEGIGKGTGTGKED